MRACARRRHAQPAAPLLSHFLLFGSLFVCDAFGTAWLVWDLRNPGVLFDFSFRLYQIGDCVAGRTICRGEHKASGGRRSQARKTWAFCSSPGRPTTDKPTNVVRLRRTSTTSISPQPWIVLFSFLALSAFTLLGREQAMTSQLFLVFPWRSETYKEAWSRNRNNTTQTGTRRALRLAGGEGPRYGRQHRRSSPFSPSLIARHRHHFNALGRTSFSFVKKQHIWIRMVMVGTCGGHAEPPKARPAWLLAILFRRAEFWADTRL